MDVMIPEDGLVGWKNILVITCGHSINSKEEVKR